MSKNGFCYKKVLKIVTILEHLKIHSASHFNYVFFTSDPLRDFVVTLPND